MEELLVGHCAIQLARGDITRIPVDAIVNAANHMLAGGGGVDGAIHKAAGPELMQELRQYDACPTGSAVVTGSGRLPAKYVIHAVGPVYRGGQRDEAALLASCYRTALQLAEERNCQSISFPSISTGVYGYPIPEAAAIALSTLIEALPDAPSIRVVKLVQFNEVSYQAYSRLMDNFLSKQSGAQTG
jgi:O-acetyl-ADP-ribose deacetylase (regulator of RNase III)